MFGNTKKLNIRLGLVFGFLVGMLIGFAVGSLVQLSMLVLFGWTFPFWGVLVSTGVWAVLFSFIFNLFEKETIDK